MIRLALKNIRQRFGSYVWLFLELTAVAFLSWFVVDELVVLNWSYSRPLGYDADRLITLRTEVDDADQQEIDARTADLRRMLARFRAMPEVEAATVVDGESLPEMSLIGTSTIQLNDSLNLKYSNMSFVPLQDYFTTMGIQSVDENQTSEYLSELNPVGEGNWATGGWSPVNPFVMTESLANALYPGGNPYLANDSLRAADQYAGRLMAMVKDVRRLSTEVGNTWISFSPVTMETVAKHWRGATIVLRIRPEYSPREVADGLRKDMAGLKEGTRRVESVKTYPEIIDDKQFGESGLDRRLNLIFAIFFMLNVCVGVMGAFWMMTRKRAREVGVLRTFGSTPGGVRRLLALEAVILAVGAWIAGCAAYYWWARTHGLYMPDDGGLGLHAQIWVNNFPQHFAIISAVILALLLLSVLIGVLLPALRLSRIHPVTALRDE